MLHKLWSQWFLNSLSQLTVPYRRYTVISDIYVSNFSLIFFMYFHVNSIKAALVQPLVMGAIRHYPAQIWSSSVTQYDTIGAQWVNFWGPFYKHGLTLIPAWTSNDMPSIEWGQITLPFPNFNGYTVEVWEMGNCFHPTFIMGVIIYPCWGWLSTWWPWAPFDLV